MKAEAEQLTEITEVTASRRLSLWPSKWRWRLSLIALIALALFALAIWIGRERIAGDLIDDALGEYGIEASYDIVSIGPQQQVIENVVIGDPLAPDFTAERVNVDIAFSLGSTGIGRVELVRPRLYGTLRDGTLSLGALDPLIYGESEGPGGLPEFDLGVVDGRARIDSDFGVIGLKFDGSGPLDDGFQGKLAATAPGLGLEDCDARTATLYGDVSTQNGSPRFEGPLRFSDARCGGASVERADIQAALVLSRDFSELEGTFGVDAARFDAAGASIGVLAGSADLTLGLTTGPDDGIGNLAFSHDLAASNFAVSGVSFSGVSLEGTLRAREALQTGDWQARLEGEGAQIDQKGISALASARERSAGTFVAALIGKLERGLASSVNGGTLAADLTARISEETTSVIVPEARLRSADGETVLALSRVSYSSRGERLSGSFLTGGADTPRVNGRVQQVDGGAITLRMNMAEYREGTDAFAIPRLEVRRDAGGVIRFNGLVQASGSIPGGEMRGLTLPVEGAWSTLAGLVAGRQCATVRIGALQYAQLGLKERSVTLCPEEGGAMVRYDDALQVVISSTDLELAGTLGEAPTTVSAGKAVMRYPGPFMVENLSAVIGPPDSAVRLSAATLEGGIGDQIVGRFEGAEAALDLVPLDLSEMTGSWSYEQGVLAIDEGGFVLTERTGPGLAPKARFEPLVAQGATLTLADNAITALADLRHPASGTRVASISIDHALTSGSGHADILVPGLPFSKNLQPQDLSYLAEGVIAFADGIVEGEGRIDWTSDAVNSSGAFRSDGFDFAAAFGPVKGVRGEIVFTDLINLTTAPSQVIEIGSVNPGIEALAGRVVFSMENGEVIRLEDGRWPFMGGELILYPTTFVYGGADGQNYVFEIVALDAASFVSQLELSNIGATGTFDGTIQVFFDANGNGSIERGLLISRPPGGNVSYVGELTYEDLGTMANYAFQSLRSLDYNQMSIELSGNLGGEILTNFNIDGVRQGAGASQNIVTRQLAQLPIRFKINVRSENFALLATIVRGLFDPTLFDTEAARELVGIPGVMPIVTDPEPSPAPETPDATGEAQRRDEPAVQPPESDELP